jgi:hypothetical protein
VAGSTNFAAFKQGVMGLHPWCRECLRDYQRDKQARLGRPIRKVQALPGSPPRVQLPTPQALEMHLDRMCMDVADGSRFKAYLIRNEITRQCYVGITEREIRARWKQHLVSASKDGGYLLHQALRHHGLDNFTFTHIASATTRANLNELERLLVAQYRAVEDGYNQTRGGSTGEAVGQQVTVQGQQFISRSAAARHFGITESTNVHQRIGRYGWTLEQAFGLEARPKRKGARSVEFAVGGVTFDSFTAACERHGLDESVVRGRLKADWSIDQAFGLAPMPRKGRNAGKPVVVNGVRYTNVVTASKLLGLKAATVAKRLREGWLVDEAFDVCPRQHRWAGKAISVGGSDYVSIADACRQLGKKESSVASRLSHGWTLEQAFGLGPAPAPSGEKNGGALTVDGVAYSSRAKAAKAHGLDPRIVHKRLMKFGWTLDQAFGLSPPPARRSSKGPNEP